MGLVKVVAILPHYYTAILLISLCNIATILHGNFTGIGMKYCGNIDASLFAVWEVLIKFTEKFNFFNIIILKKLLRTIEKVYKVSSFVNFQNYLISIFFYIVYNIIYLKK